jgi:Zn-dependent protease
MGLANKSQKGAKAETGLLRLAASLAVIFVSVNLIIAMLPLVLLGSEVIPSNDVLPYLFESLGQTISITISWIPQVLVPLLGILLLEITAHELGHVLAGKAAGFRFVLLVIGPLRISREGEDLKFGRREAWEPQLGAALSVPTDSHELRRRTALTVAGGPAASLLLGLTSALLSVLFPQSGLPGDLFRMSAWVSLLSAFVNMLPLKSGGHLSDGARIKMLLAGGAASERYCFLSALSGASRTGQRPREWDETWMQRINDLADGSFDDAAASHISFYWMLDRGEIDGAESTLQRLLAAAMVLPEAMHPVLHMEAAFFYAYYRHDLEKARSCLEKAGKSQPGRHYHMHARAEAAVLALEGHPKESGEKAASGLAHMEREKTRGPGWELDYEWLQALATPRPAV